MCVCVCGGGGGGGGGGALRKQCNPHGGFQQCHTKTKNRIIILVNLIIHVYRETGP